MDIPDVLIGEIFLSLTINQIREYCFANRKTVHNCGSVLNDDFFWRKKLALDYNIDVSHKDAKSVNFKDIYKYLYWDKDRKDLNNAFFYAAQNNSTDVLLVILKNLNEKPEKFSIYLGLAEAIKNGNLDSIKLILKYTEIDFKDKYLDIAIKNNQPNVINYFIFEKNIDVGKDVYPLIMWAAKYNHVKIFEHFLDQEILDTFYKREDLLKMAAKYGNLEIIKLILANTELNYIEISNIIAFASREGMLNIVEYLLSIEKLVFHLEIKMILISSARSGHVNIINYLLSNERFIRYLENFSEVKNDLIDSAAMYGHFEVFKIFLKLGATIDRPELWRLALVEGQNIEIVKILLSKDAYIKDEVQNADLIGGNEELAKILLESGKIKLNKLCYTLLYKSANEDDQDMAEFIGSNENYMSLLSRAQLKDCLEVAAHKKNVKIVKLILSFNTINLDEKEQQKYINKANR